MKYCIQCGAQVPDDARFCPECRAYLPEKKDPKENRILRKQFRCPECGASFERASYDGQPPTFGFCGFCGYSPEEFLPDITDEPTIAVPKSVPTEPAKVPQLVTEKLPKTLPETLPPTEPMHTPPTGPAYTPPTGPVHTLPETPPAAPEGGTFAWEPPELKKERGGLRWWHIALPVLILALAAVGLFAYRTMQHPVEEVWYDAGRSVSAVDYYDRNGHITGCDGYADGEIAYTKEYRVAEDADRIDVSQVEQTDGVRTVECLQVYQRREGHSGFMPENVYKVFGYDRRGHLLAEQQYFCPEDAEPILAYSVEYERDLFGRPVRVTITAGNGDAFLERAFDAESAFGLFTQADVTETQYGTLEYVDGVYFVTPYDTPRDVAYTVQYHH